MIIFYPPTISSGNPTFQPVEDPRGDKSDKGKSCAIPSANLAQPPNTRAKPQSPLVRFAFFTHELIVNPEHNNPSQMPSTPNTSHPPSAAKSSEATSVLLADTSEEQLASATPLSTQSRIQPPSLHRNRTWNKNRHIHIGSSKKDDLSSSGSLPTTLQSLPTQATPSNPVPVSSIPRSPVAHSHLPVARSLPPQRTEWIYRQPKMRSSSLSVSTSSSSPSTLAPKHISPPSPSRIPLRTRTRPTSSRTKPRPRPQTGFHPHVINIPANPAKKPVHTTLPARPPLALKTTPPQANNKTFWSSLLSRKSDPVKRSVSNPITPGSSSFELLDVATEKSGTASSSLSSLLSQKNYDKEEKAKEAKKAAKLPSQTSSSGLSSLSTSASQAINVTCSVGKGAGLTRSAALAPPHSITSTGSPPRTRSSSASSNSSSSTSRSVSTAATSTSAVSSSPTSPVPTSTKPIHNPAAQVSMSPSKSILSRTSSTASSSRLLHRVAPFTTSFDGTPSSSKSVTFVDVPTVHYATSYAYSDGECESDIGGIGTSGTRGISEEVELETSDEQAAKKAGNGARSVKQGQVTGARWGGNDMKRSGGSYGYWHDQGVDVEAMDLTIKEEDEDVEAMHSEANNANLHEPFQSPAHGAQQRRQRPNPISLKKADTDGAVGLKRLMSLTRKPADSPRKAEMKIAGEVRLNISGPFALGSLPSSLPLTPPSPSLPTPPTSPYSRSTPYTGRSSSSTASLRSHLSYSSSIKHKTPSRSASARTTHYKSYSYSGRMPIPFAPIAPSSAATTSSYDTTRSHGFYPASLRAAPSLESFKSTAGRSVRSLGSAKSTTRTQGFRAWLARLAEGVGISGGIEDDEY